MFASRCATPASAFPIEKQDKLFQPFQRAGQETGPIEGTGIGLVITKRLAELMNGERRLPQRARRGLGVLGRHARCTLHAPLGDRDARTGRGSRARGFRRSGQRLVLYVEDNPANVAFMRDSARHVRGHRPGHRADGRDGHRARSRATARGRHHGHQPAGNERPRRAAGAPRTGRRRRTFRSSR